MPDDDTPPTAYDQARLLFLERRHRLTDVIRQIARLLAQTDDRDEMLGGVCRGLTASRGYHHAWIALFDGTGRLTATGHSGLREPSDALHHQLVTGPTPRCAATVLDSETLVGTRDPEHDCAGCPLTHLCAGRGALTLRIAHGTRVYGMLAVALPQDSALDPDERYLLVEVAADLGVALHRLDLQEHRRAAEEELGLTACALSASEERHRRLLERLRLHSLTLNQIQDLVAMTDLDGTITFVNDATCRALNLPREELLGRDVRKLDVTPADSAIDPDGIVRRTLATGFWRGRIISRGNDPREIILDCRTHVVRDEANTPVALCSISTDITEQLALEAQLHQSQKLESVGRLAGGVAHDFNNMLGVILGHAEMALQRAALHPKLRHSLETIGKAAERSADLTRQLLAFARKQTIHPRALDLDDAVASMFKMLQRLIGEEIELKFRPQGELWPVRIDPSQVDQILANLCVNARDAIPGHGRIVIATANRPADLDNGGAEAVELTITDDGCGMDAATGEHIFEPFFTTKEVGAGTGLGLSTVYGIVQQNDGEITFVSEPDQGSTFTIRLPRTREVAAPAGDGLATAATGDGETILLVEDEPGMLSTTRAMLEDLGYAVLTAAGPEEALRRAAGHPGFIDLLLTDVIMPGMHGSQLAARLVDRQPGLPVLYMSGHPADTIAHQGVLDPDLHFLSKPFTRTGLARTVRSILAGA